MTFSQALCQRKDINLTSCQSHTRYTVLSFAASTGNLEMLKFIKKIVIERLGKEEFVKMLNRNTDFGITPLHVAADKNKPKAVEFLMALEECDHRKAAENGCTPLHTAACKRLGVVKILLEASRFSNDEKLRREYLEMKKESGKTALDKAKSSRSRSGPKVIEVSLKSSFSLFTYEFCANE